LGGKRKAAFPVWRKAALFVGVGLRGFPWEGGYNDHHQHEKNHQKEQTKHWIIAWYH